MLMCHLTEHLYCWQVRSLTLDVRVWEPSVIGYFQSIGNKYANTIWEELLTSDSGGTEDLGKRCVCILTSQLILLPYLLLVYNTFCDLLLM